MPLQARVGDMSTGHWIGNFYFFPVPLLTGALSSLSGGPPMCRVGDVAALHIGYLFGVIPVPAVFHIPTAATGSPDKIIEGSPAFRTGDLYDCGDIQAGGLENHLVD